MIFVYSKNKYVSSKITPVIHVFRFTQAYGGLVKIQNQHELRAIIMHVVNKFDSPRSSNS